MLRGIKREVRLNRAFLLIIIANQYGMEGKSQIGLAFLACSAIMAVTAFLSED